MKISEEFKYDLKQNNPIEQVMGEYLTLKRESGGYVCVCPFHPDNNPSCHINTAKGFFHCFGCQTGGDVITFIRMKENLDYIDAIKFLADRAKMQMPDDPANDEGYRMRARVLEMNRAAARFYFDILAKSPEGEKGRRYFRDRQLSNATITKYGLGYAPDGWDALRSHMHGLGYSDDELVTASLCTRNQKGNVFDSFRDRVIFPIIDTKGSVVAFGGRIIDGSGPKYLNSSDTPVFKKSRELFSLNFAKKSPERRLILAEGYMDVIAINQAGFENVVATLGTALTQKQAEIMKGCADEVIISYDSDAAGTAAKHRAIKILSDAGLRVRVLQVEDAKDPDEYIKKFGAIRFKQLIEGSEAGIEFELSKIAESTDMGTPAGRSVYAEKCVPVLADITKNSERDIYISYVSEKSGIAKEAILKDVENEMRKRTRFEKKNQERDILNNAEQRRNAPESIGLTKEYRAERGIIAYLEANPDELSYIESKLSPDDFVTDFNKRVYKELVSGMKSSPLFDIMSIQSEFTAEETGRIIEIIEKNKGVYVNRAVLDEYIDVLLEHREKSVSARDMSDDDFLKRFENTKKKKVK